MSDTPIFNELTETLAPDHAVFSLDPAAVLDTSEIPEDILGTPPEFAELTE